MIRLIQLLFLPLFLLATMVSCTSQSQSTMHLVPGGKGCALKPTRILLTGDLTENMEPTLLPIGPVDVLQVAHHGSYTSSSKAFLEDVRPDYALISCGKSNEYGHPHNVVIARLEDVDARIHRTDEEGTLLVRIVEGQIAVTSEHKP